MTTTRLLWTLGVLFVLWTVLLLLGSAPGPIEMLIFFLLGVAAIAWWGWGRSRNGAHAGES
jgi:hypothetical protein